MRQSIFLPLLTGALASAQSPPFPTNGTITLTTSAPAPTNTTSTPPLSTTAVPYQLQTPPLDTPWTNDVGTDPWPEHPRPQLRRDNWQNLNGIWTYQPANTSAEGASPPEGTFAHEILIPSCIESGLSGIQDFSGVLYMWFETSFKVDPELNGRKVLLHFEAVDYQATVYINGVQAGTNTGGYFRFTIDATDFLNIGGVNQVKVFVYDPTDLEGEAIPVGKQARSPSHIFYRACSGIWQTVWLESTPINYISQLDVAAGMEGNVTVTVHTDGAATNGTRTPVEVQVIDQDGSVVGTGSGSANSEFSFTVDGVELWTPDSPTLYNLTITMGDDVVNSYTGFRTISSGVVDGVQRPLLNGEFVFQFGTLDQGFWPDGLHLAPTLEALVFDLQELKKLGMNTVRKHIKIEPDLFYHACDTIGLMVFQDMPAISPNRPDEPFPNATQQQEFERQILLMVNEHLSYPSIVTWIVYNEGWGQIRDNGTYPEFSITDRIRAIDPTRLINSVSGWFDHGAGDYHDNHHYASPQCGTPWYSTPSTPYDPTRISLQGEWGGIGHNVSIENLWNVQEAIDTINQTYEINADLEVYNFRAHRLFGEFLEQVQLFSCSGGIWTQTTDVEGEVNGLITYDRRVERVDVAQWQDDIAALYSAAAGRGGAGNATQARLMA